MTTRNRLGNCHNKFQGNAKKVLCVCSAGLLRSPTAAAVLQREYGFNTRSCGAEEDFALIVADEVLMEWADQIVCMQPSHKDALVANTLVAYDDPRIVVLNVPDRYDYMNNDLQDIILAQYKLTGNNKDLNEIESAPVVSTGGESTGIQTT